ncbi:hypothetical protein FB45DRAFT_945667 [Roridomyces roridus]|uniref:Uncharacterized protein n=1 Tax=Roridomyces roridus TaxID=1738132 RepID=A0AAD7F8F5_9AGAR|nr:hypothetical protein FB45DRAFT_945667 [Roridomyces roridus]
MDCAKREYAFFVCLGGLLSASVGFSISLFATILSFFISGPQQPIIQIPDAAVKASTPSPPSPSKDARDEKPRSLSRHRSPVKLRLVQAKGQVYVQLDMKRTPSMSSETTVVESEQVVHFEPLKDQPVISVSPAPTQSSFTSESSTSQLTVDSTETSPDARGRRRRSRFKLFGDKRACKDVSTLPASGATSPTRISRSPSPLRELQRSTTCRPKALLTRVASCPGFHHSRRSNSGSSFADLLPPVPAIPTLPSLPPSPADSPRCWLSERREKEKEVASPPPKPRTQPYAAPYFALPPDSKPGPGVLPPIGERRKTSSSVGARRKQRVATS